MVVVAEGSLGRDMKAEVFLEPPLVLGCPPGAGSVPGGVAAREVCGTRGEWLEREQMQSRTVDGAQLPSLKPQLPGQQRKRQLWIKAPGSAISKGGEEMCIRDSLSVCLACVSALFVASAAAAVAAKVRRARRREPGTLPTFPQSAADSGAGSLPRSYVYDVRLAAGTVDSEFRFHGHLFPCFPAGLPQGAADQRSSLCSAGLGQQEGDWAMQGMKEGVVDITSVSVFHPFSPNYHIHYPVRTIGINTRILIVWKSFEILPCTVFHDDYDFLRA
ncbi:UNVERIFIED_CONTAM: hypothetical protein H355_003196 [Colinus virginianus]|nr:hypothetical protein H355_003196 [Colinus virginianus]